MISNSFSTSVNKVSKSFKEHLVLKDINIELKPGEVMGFVGPNGAGKTTLIRILAGLEAPTKGSVSIPKEGLVPGSPGIGLVMERAPFVEHLSGFKNLELLGYIRNNISSEQIKQAILRVGLDPSDKKKVKHYSFGMRQRLALAQAIMESPRLLLLDEPTNGLDAQAIIELRDSLKSLAKESGITIFLASHMLTEVENICDRVLMVQQGRILKTFEKESDQLAPIVFKVSSSIDTDSFLDLLKTRDLNHEIINNQEILIKGKISIPDLIKSAVMAGINIEGVAKKAASLEEEFISLLIRGDDGRLN